MIFNNVDLVAGKTYKIELAKGTAYDNQKNCITTEPVSVYFTAVSELPAKAPATHGVQAVKFFRNRPNAGVEVYVPGSGFKGQDVISAEALVNNTTEEDMNFNMIIASYSADGCLQDVSVGDCYVPADKEGRVVSTGAVQLQDAAGVAFGERNVTFKAFLIDDMDTLIPLCPAVLSDPVVNPGE